MLTIALNVVTILIALYILGLTLKEIKIREVKQRMEDESSYVSATELADAISKDPLIVSRAYFTEDDTVPTTDFEGISPRPKDDWVHGFPHEKA